MSSDTPTLASLTARVAALECLVADLRDRAADIPAQVSAALTALHAALGSPDVLEMCYHADADPGDGSGWAVVVGDRHTYGTIGGAVEAQLAQLQPDTRAIADEFVSAMADPGSPTPVTDAVLGDELDGP